MYSQYLSISEYKILTDIIPIDALSAMLDMCPD